MNTDPEIVEIKDIVQQNQDMLQRYGEILQQHGEMLLEVVKEQNYLRGALDQVNERFSTLDARIGSLDNRMISVEGRMNSLEARLTDAESRLSKDIRDNFKWTMGLMIPVWFGILAAIAVELLKN